jgi:hypothetical protein
MVEWRQQARRQHAILKNAAPEDCPPGLPRSSMTITPEKERQNAQDLCCHHVGNRAHNLGCFRSKRYVLRITRLSNTNSEERNLRRMQGDERCAELEVVTRRMYWFARTLPLKQLPSTVVLSESWPSFPGATRNLLSTTHCTIRRSTLPESPSQERRFERRLPSGFDSVLLLLFPSGQTPAFRRFRSGGPTRAGVSRTFPGLWCFASSSNIKPGRAEQSASKFIS